jgi:hypothetical protein
VFQSAGCSLLRAEAFNFNVFHGGLWMANNVKIGFFASGKILPFLSLKTLDSDPPMLIHNLSFKMI